MKRTSFARMHCSLARGLDLIGDWWSPLIVRDLFLDVVRFDDLIEDLGISRNLLTRRLNALIKSGIVERHAYQRRPRRYEYRLTEAGRDLVPAILALTAWGDRWARPKEGSPMLFVHKTCGQHFEPQVTCSACGEVITGDAVKTVGGPGGAMKAGTKVLARRLAPTSSAPRARRSEPRTVGRGDDIAAAHHIAEAPPRRHTPSRRLR
ncbi:MAG: helix-turn-helix domain-containing protein [Xanthobacteraceae bacterium]